MWKLPKKIREFKKGWDSRSQSPALQRRELAQQREGPRSGWNEQWGENNSIFETGARNLRLRRDRKH